MPDILRTPAGEPAVVYAIVDESGHHEFTSNSAGAAQWVCREGERIVPCHLLPLPEDARTVQREGGADVE